MAKRRGNGEGCIYHRADGRWEGRYSAPDGKRRAVYGKTQAEAKAKLRAKLREIEAGGGRGEERRTVAAYLASWLEGKRPTVRASSWTAYRLHVDRYLVPALGSRRLAQLTPAHVRLALAGWLEDGTSEAMVAKVLTTLRMALGQAVRDGTLPRNVAAVVAKPKAPRPMPRALASEGVAAILAAVDGDRLAPLVTLSLLTGLRQGEALGLQWPDVDLEAGTLTVRATLARGLDGAAPVLLAPKTTGSRRAVPLSPLAIDALRRQRALQGRERLAAGWRSGPPFVFTTPAGGMLDGRNVTRQFQELLRRAGLERIRWHDLRGGCLTMLATEGVAPRAAQTLAGHSSASLTLNVYTGVPPEAVRDAVNRIDAAIRRAGWTGGTGALEGVEAGRF